MNTGKCIILLMPLLLLPLFSEAQIYRAPTKREAEQIGKKIWIISTGDTTRVVNPVSGGLVGAGFLVRKNRTAEADSIFGEIDPNYNNLEEAVLDIDKLLREVGHEKKINNERNDALGFRLARDYRNRKKKEQAAMNIADSLMKKDASIEELTNMYMGFNGKPTYYINGLEVPYSVINQLYSSEVIKREMRVIDTASGNPFGEVWYLVSEKTLDRLKIPVDPANDCLFDNNTSVTVTVAPANDTFAPGKKTSKVPEPVIRREITTDGKQVDRVVKPEEKIPAEPTTRVISRTVNDEKVDPDNNAAVINRPGIKPVVNPPQSAIRQQHYNSVNTADRLKQEKPVKAEEKKEYNTAPKKSVRSIRERLRDQYKD
ncbi:MAG: hypothetical protein LBR26_10740 [Prevotella sp.]|jgi:hypothetical protein|nr:hypothetical protein [Prevotella sp.]